MSRETIDFWQDHSVNYLEMALKTDRMEPIADPDGIGTHHGDCGDTVEMLLKLRGDTIVQVALQVRGCLNTVASANAVAELVEGRPVRDAWELTPEKVAAYLAILPRGPPPLRRIRGRRPLPRACRPAHQTAAALEKDVLQGRRSLSVPIRNGLRAMGECTRHPDSETPFQCLKYDIWMCAECIACRDPGLYCKNRLACPIWFLERHGEREQ